MAARRKVTKPRRHIARAIIKSKPNGRPGSAILKPQNLTIMNGKAGSTTFGSSMPILHSHQPEMSEAADALLRGVPSPQSIDRFEVARRLAQATTAQNSHTEKASAKNTNSVKPPKFIPMRRRVLRPRPASVATLPTTALLPPSPRLIKSHALLTSPQGPGRIHKVQIGSYLINVWYLAPYPEEYSRLETLYVCEFCLQYMKSTYIAKRHKMKCPMRHPPGNEIYRDGVLSVFEIDGSKNKIYCQNLCLLAKMFLDHKTLYYDVEPFWFYVLTETDKNGCHFVGYFSKEKRSVLGYNLSCIMTLPAHQRKGYGQFLIDFSYLLSRTEGKVGSPEKPLSDLGLLSFRKYWFQKICSVLDSLEGPVTIDDLSQRTSMTVDDVVATLELNHMIQRQPDGEYKIIIKERSTKTHQHRPIAKAELLTWVPMPEYALQLATPTSC